MNSESMSSSIKWAFPGFVALVLLAIADAAFAQAPLRVTPQVPLAAPEAATPAPTLPELQSELQYGPQEPVIPRLGAPGLGAPLSPALTAPPALTVAPGACQPCDYWIVSSRKCRAKEGKNGSNCCLQFFHRTSERCLLPTDRPTFFGSLDPARPVCFLIHGSYNRWGGVVSESWLINNWIRSAANATQSSLQVVFFTWPSDGNMPFIFPIDIALLGRRSSFHALYLSQLINELPPAQPVSLLGHSHGARTATAAMHLLGGGSIEGGYRLGSGPGCPRRLRAVLLAPAIDHDWLNPGDRYGMALCPAERVLIVRNSRDFTLAIYSIRYPFSGRSLGRNGLDVCDRLSLNGLNPKVTEMDVAPFVHTRHAWAKYYERPELAAGILPYLDFHDEPPMTGPPAWPPTPFPALQLPADSVPASPTPVAPMPVGSSNRSKSNLSTPAQATPGGVPRLTDPTSTSRWKAKPRKQPDQAAPTLPATPTASPVPM